MCSMHGRGFRSGLVYLIIVVGKLPERDRVQNRMAAHDWCAPIYAGSALSLREPPAPGGHAMASVTSLHVEAASTLAVVASSNEPLLLLAADLKVIAASASFCRAFQIDPASVPGLRDARIICELHDFIAPGITDTIVSRFSPSHTIELIDTQDRDERPSQLQHLGEEDWRAAVREGRPAEMRWAVMLPRSQLPSQR